GSSTVTDTNHVTGEAILRQSDVNGNFIKEATLSGKQHSNTLTVVHFAGGVEDGVAAGMEQGRLTFTGYSHNTVEQFLALSEAAIRSALPLHSTAEPPLFHPDGTSESVVREMKNTKDGLPAGEVPHADLRNTIGPRGKLVARIQGDERVVYDPHQPLETPLFKVDQRDPRSRIEEYSVRFLFEQGGGVGVVADGVLIGPFDFIGQQTALAGTQVTTRDLLTHLVKVEGYEIGLGLVASAATAKAPTETDELVMLTDLTTVERNAHGQEIFFTTTRTAIQMDPATGLMRGQEKVVETMQSSIERVTRDGSVITRELNLTTSAETLREIDINGYVVKSVSTNGNLLKGVPPQDADYPTVTFLGYARTVNGRPLGAMGTSRTYGFGRRALPGDGRFTVSADEVDAASEADFKRRGVPVLRRTEAPRYVPVNPDNWDDGYRVVYDNAFETVFAGDRVWGEQRHGQVWHPLGKMISSTQGRHRTDYDPAAPLQKPRWKIDLGAPADPEMMKLYGGRLLEAYTVEYIAIDEFTAAGMHVTIHDHLNNRVHVDVDTYFARMGFAYRTVYGSQGNAKVTEVTFPVRNSWGAEYGRDIYHGDRHGHVSDRWNPATKRWELTHKKFEDRNVDFTAGNGPTDDRLTTSRHDIHRDIHPERVRSTRTYDRERLLREVAIGPRTTFIDPYEHTSVTKDSSGTATDGEIIIERVEDYISESITRKHDRRERSDLYYFEHGRGIRLRDATVVINAFGEEQTVYVDQHWDADPVQPKAGEDEKTIVHYNARTGREVKRVVWLRTDTEDNRWYLEREYGVRSRTMSNYRWKDGQLTQDVEHHLTHDTYEELLDINGRTIRENRRRNRVLQINGLPHVLHSLEVETGVDYEGATERRTEATTKVNGALKTTRLHKRAYTTDGGATWHQQSVVKPHVFGPSVIERYRIGDIHSRAEEATTYTRTGLVMRVTHPERWVRGTNVASVSRAEDGYGRTIERLRLLMDAPGRVRKEVEDTVPLHRFIHTVVSPINGKNEHVDEERYLIIGTGILLKAMDVETVDAGMLPTLYNEATYYVITAPYDGAPEYTLNMPDALGENSDGKALTLHTIQQLRHVTHLYDHRITTKDGEPVMDVTDIGLRTGTGTGQLAKTTRDVFGQPLAERQGHVQFNERHNLVGEVMLREARQHGAYTRALHPTYTPGRFVPQPGGSYAFEAGTFVAGSGGIIVNQDGRRDLETAREELITDPKAEREASETIFVRTRWHSPRLLPAHAAMGDLAYGWWWSWQVEHSTSDWTTAFTSEALMAPDGSLRAVHDAKPRREGDGAEGHTYYLPVLPPTRNVALSGRLTYPTWGDEYTVGVTWSAPLFAPPAADGALELPHRPAQPAAGERTAPQQDLSGFDALYFYVHSDAPIDAQRVNLTVTDGNGRAVTVDSGTADAEAGRINFFPLVGYEEFTPDDKSAQRRLTIRAPPSAVRQHGLWAVSIAQLLTAGLDISDVASVRVQGLPAGASVSRLGLLGDGTTQQTGLEELPLRQQVTSYHDGRARTMTHRETRRVRQMLPEQWQLQPIQEEDIATDLLPNNVIRVRFTERGTNWKQEHITFVDLSDPNNPRPWNGQTPEQEFLETYAVIRDADKTLIYMVPNKMYATKLQQFDSTLAGEKTPYQTGYGEGPYVIVLTHNGPLGTLRSNIGSNTFVSAVYRLTGPEAFNGIRDVLKLVTANAANHIAMIQDQPPAAITSLNTGDERPPYEGVSPDVAPGTVDRASYLRATLSRRVGPDALLFATAEGPVAASYVDTKREAEILLGLLQASNDDSLPAGLRRHAVQEAAKVAARYRALSEHGTRLLASSYHPVKMDRTAGDVRYEPVAYNVTFGQRDNAKLTASANVTMAYVWLELYRATGDHEALEAAKHMLRLLFWGPSLSGRDRSPFMHAGFRAGLNETPVVDDAEEIPRGKTAFDERYKGETNVKALWLLQAATQELQAAGDPMARELEPIAQAQLEWFVRYFVPFVQRWDVLPSDVFRVFSPYNHDPVPYQFIQNKGSTPEDWLWALLGIAELRQQGRLQDVTQEDLRRWFDNAWRVFGVKAPSPEGGEEPLYGFDAAMDLGREQGRAIFGPATALAQYAAQQLGYREPAAFFARQLERMRQADLIAEVAGVSPAPVGRLGLETHAGTMIPTTKEAGGAKQWPGSPEATNLETLSRSGEKLYDGSRVLSPRRPWRFMTWLALPLLLNLASAAAAHANGMERYIERERVSLIMGKLWEWLTAVGGFDLPGYFLVPLIGYTFVSFGLWLAFNYRRGRQLAPAAGDLTTEAIREEAEVRLNERVFNTGRMPLVERTAYADGPVTEANFLAGLKQWIYPLAMQWRNGRHDTDDPWLNGLDEFVMMASLFARKVARDGQKEGRRRTITLDFGWLLLGG
ncbi:MAG: hypothetical protein HY598_02805, partial [Candidatus Omnitrophica bacterium]|nr:hypothetical protein [Candidatus Omnitrophota bacterium]